MALLPMSDHHITVSEHTAGELIQASRGHKVRRGIWVAPMGVDRELSIRDESIPRSGLTRVA